LSGPILGGHLTTIDLAEKITVSPYYIIRNRFKELPQAAKDFYDEVLLRI
jgi:hypothetical protein